MSSAARELARAVAAAAMHEPATVTVKNLSSLGPADVAEIGRLFEAELKTAGPPTTEVQLTISENLTQYLLVAELHRGEHRVLLESWPRTSASPTGAGTPRMTLERKLLWEQDQPILDAAQTASAILVLDASRVLLAHGADLQSAPLPATHPWPRDLRGRLSFSNTAFTAWLPGTICHGATEPQLSLECRDSTDSWFLAPGAIATFAPARNTFQGHLDIEPGGPRDLPPFYSAAPAADGWIFAATDGRAHIYTNSFEPSGTVDHWGSDIAAVQTPCGPRLLVTRPSALSETDAVQPYRIAGAAPMPAGPPLEFPGPITALWSTGGTAVAVSRDLQTRRYAAYSLSPNCGS